LATEKKVMENIVTQGENTIRAHLEHLKSHGAEDYYRDAAEFLEERGIPVPEEKPAPEEVPCGCPGARVIDFADGEGTCPPGEEEEARGDRPKAGPEAAPAGPRPSRLAQWPIQIMLVPPMAPYLRDADLVVAADCVPFAYADFHEDFLKGRVLLIGCPKLDDAAHYEKKFTSILEQNDVRSVTVVHMEVPCCFGLVKLVQSAVEASGKSIPFSEVTVGVRGQVLSQAGKV
jgi:hypothetical protein